MELSNRELTIVLAGLRLLQRDPGFAREFLVGQEDESAPTAVEMEAIIERVETPKGTVTEIGRAHV